jgi:5-(carboxyamino)imidazole ribonucleotide synthase
VSKILGIIGGGQLGMMLTEAAKNMPLDISKVIVLDPTENCPAAKVGAEQIIADFKDESSIRELAERSDLITYEIESGNSDVLKNLESKCEINPSPETLRMIQDKLLQKKFLDENDIPVAKFAEVSSKEELESKIDEFKLPVLLKTRRDAYDGRGNFKINTKEQVTEALQSFNGQLLMVEEFVDFKMEVSVIAARSTTGEIKTYSLVENTHEENILKTTIAPARIAINVSNKAEQIAQKTMELLHGAGVFGIEMFVDQDDNILINEIAPRVHNSGHHTLQSCKISQFEQHLRAILGLNLGNTELVHKTVMCNILGPDGFEGKYKPIELEKDGVYLKMYGKDISKPHRKLGHFNVVDLNDSKDTFELLKIADEVKNSLNFTS